jgi:nicotinamidase-related amidase
MQNDNCHSNGVYNTHGLTSANVNNIIPNVVETMHFCNKMSIPIIATQLTVLEDLNKGAIGLDSYQTIRPFLKKEGFREGTWGHELLEELPSPNYKIRKWGMSAFFQTELGRYLSALNCEEIILTGFTTNGSVETLAREALGRSYKITTLTDCVTTYSEMLNQTSLTNLGSFGTILTSKEWIKQFEGKI